MNFVLHNVSTGERTIVPEVSICSWKDHKICTHHKGQFVLAANLRIVSMEIFQQLHEVVVYVQEQGDITICSRESAPVKAWTR